MVIVFVDDCVLEVCVFPSILFLGRGIKDVLNESLELSDLIISKTTNIKSNKSKLINILKQEVKILT